MSTVIQGTKSKKYERHQANGIEGAQDNFQHLTVQEVSGERAAADVVNHGTTVVSTGKSIEAGSVKRLINCTAHGAQQGWIMRPSSGNSAGQEISIVKITSANQFCISTEFDLAIGDTFSLLKFITQNFDADGNLIVAIAPPAGGATSANQVLEIAQLTAINANTDGLEALEAAGNASLSSIDTKTPTLVGGKVPVDTGLVQALTDVQLRATPVPVSGTVAVTGAGDASAANQVLQITQETAINTVLGLQADAAAASDTGTASYIALFKRLLTKIPAIGPQTKAASQSVAFATDLNVVSIVNSTVANLGISAVFTGTSENVSQYAEIKILVSSDQSSATNGLSIQQSSNGTNWDIVDTFSVTANVAQTIGVGVDGSFYRIVYTNGAVATTSLRIQSIYHVFRTRPSSIKPQDARSNEIDVEESASYQSAFNGANWDRIRSGLSGAITLLTGYQNVLWVGKYNTTAPTLTNGQFIEPQFDVNGNLKTVASGSGKVATYVASITIDSTTAQAFTPPAGAKWVKIMASEDNVTTLRVALGSTATNVVGMEFQAGRSEDYDAVATISVLAKVTAGSPGPFTAQAIYIQWGV